MSKPNKLWFCHLATQSADKLYMIIEAESPEEATRLAEDEAIRRGDMSEFERDDPDAECYVYPPDEISPMTGSPGVRLSTD